MRISTLLVCYAMRMETAHTIALGNQLLLASAGINLPVQQEDCDLSGLGGMSPFSDSTPAPRGVTQCNNSGPAVFEKSSRRYSGNHIQLKSDVNWSAPCPLVQLAIQGFYKLGQACRTCSILKKSDVCDTIAAWQATGPSHGDANEDSMHLPH